MRIFPALKFWHARLLDDVPWWLWSSLGRTVTKKDPLFCLVPEATSKSDVGKVQGQISGKWKEKHFQIVKAFQKWKGPPQEIVESPSMGALSIGWITTCWECCRSSCSVTDWTRFTQVPCSLGVLWFLLGKWESETR